MDSAENRSTGRIMVPSPPRALRVGVACVEAGLVALIAYLLVQLTFDMMAVDPAGKPSTVTIEPQAVSELDTDRLTSFDPFYRQLESDVQNTPVVTIRESSLRIEVFGLRAADDGTGSAIIKTQDGGQKLIRIGDAVASGVTLTAVYPDRLEVNRAGIREAIYLRPQRERQQGASSRAAPGIPVSSRVSDLPQYSAGGPGFDLTALSLSEVRRERRIVGFRLPDPLPLLLTGAGLEAGDVLTSVNGVPLVSFERLQEVSEELSGSPSVLLEVERRGERLSLTISLGGDR